MSALYLDSSFLLSLLFGEMESEKYLKYWDKPLPRFSSILLRIEATVALHRHKAHADVWRLMDALLETIGLRIVDARVAERIRGDRRFGRLRSLDAIHLATACEIRDAIGEPLEIACLDSRLRDAATSFGFSLVPKEP